MMGIRRIMICTAFVFVAVAFPCKLVLSDNTSDSTHPNPNAVLTLSLQTNEGLVVIDCDTSKAALLTGQLREETDPPSSNRALFLWLLEKGVPSNDIRLYVASGKTGDMEPGLQRSQWRRSTVKESARTGEIPDISGLDLFEAYMLIRTMGSQVYLDENSISRGAAPTLLLHTVFVLSSAFNNGHHGIIVDGTNFSINKPGYNLVAISEDGEKIIESAAFEMYSDPDGGTKMAEFLNSLPSGTVLLASINYGPGVFLTSDAVEALHKFGSKELLDPEVLSSHAMIGKKGWAPGKAIEASTVNMGSNVVFFPDNLFVDAQRAGKIIPAGSGSAVILSGTAKDAPIYLYLPQ